MQCVGVFGGGVLYVSGVIVDPSLQGRGIGPALVVAFDHESAIRAYAVCTRNPALLALFGAVAGYGKDNVLTHNNSARAIEIIPGATTERDGLSYHIGRYGNGLYGAGADPAGRPYDGVPLNELCPALQEPGNALALYIPVKEKI